MRIAVDRDREPAEHAERERDAEEQSLRERAAQAPRGVERGQPGHEQDEAQQEVEAPESRIEAEGERARERAADGEARTARAFVQGSLGVSGSSSISIGMPAGASSGGTTPFSEASTWAPPSSTQS